jgi:hypothetical protein
MIYPRTLFKTFKTTTNFNLLSTSIVEDHTTNLSKKINDNGLNIVRKMLITHGLNLPMPPPHTPEHC